MRLWVRSEYTEELAVLCAWLSALVPWVVMYSDLGELGRVLYVRFPLVQVRYTYGVPLAQATRVDDPLSALALQSGRSLGGAYELWVVGAALVAVAVLFGVALYFEVDVPLARPARAMGVLLLLAALAHAVAVYQVATVLPGVPIPVGVLFQAAFGVVLLSARRPAST
jgi:hypothetical protein